jgi:hypothetical protein
MHVAIVWGSSYRIVRTERKRPLGCLVAESAFSV